MKKNPFLNNNIKLYNSDSIELYDYWESPIVIVSDGPYGVKGYPGDLSDDHDLSKWYEPHICEWTKHSTPLTTLWFWNTEQGWANVHPILEQYGWKFKACNIWDKGKGHIAGNVNTKTLSHFPVVTEVCVQYVKEPFFYNKSGAKLEIKKWLREEWERSGLPLSKTNSACDVKNAATRKYFTQCNLWYMPPPDAFEKLVNYANVHGKEEGKPYFSIDGNISLTSNDWKNLRAKFYCPFGHNNVWSIPQLKGKERLKIKGKTLHLNQKPLSLIDLIITSSSDENDVIWDPFGGLFTSAVSCIQNNRKCYSSELNPDIYEFGVKRISELLQFE